MSGRKGVGTAVIGLVVVIIMIGTIGFVMFTRQPTTPVSSESSSTSSSGTSSITSVVHSTTNSSTSASGLQLTETVNASTMIVGQSLNISVSIWNTHDFLNSIHPSDQWAFHGVPVALWPDCYFGLPAQMVVLNGSYTLQDLPKVANVTFSYICMEGVNVDHVNFQPNSDQVNLTGIYDVTGANQTLGPFHMALNFTTAGYWNLLGLSNETNTPIVGEAQPTPPSYTAFAPGVYTIAVADEWGQAVVLHVTVLPAVTSSSTSSSSGVSQVTNTTGSTVTTNSTGEAPPISSIASTNVTLSGFPNEVALDANTSRIYVSDLFANKLTVLDAATHSVIDTITLPGTSGFGLAVDAQKDMIYVPVSGCTNEMNVTNSCDSPGANSSVVGIVEIDGSTNSIVGELPINAEWLAVDSSTGKLYGLGGAGLLAIRESTGSVIANTSLNGFPVSVAIDTKTDTLYVDVCQQLMLACEGAEVLIVNGTSLAVQSSVPLGVDALNFPVIVDPETDMVYTMGTGANLTLFAINGTSGVLDYSSNLGGSCAGGGGGDLAMNTLTDQIYVSFNGQSPFLVIDAGTGQIVNMLSTENGIQYMTFSPSTLQVYVMTEAQHANIGFLLVLPSSIGQDYVNYNLLTSNACYP